MTTGEMIEKLKEEQKEIEEVIKYLEIDKRKYNLGKHNDLIHFKKLKTARKIINKVAKSLEVLK